MQRFLRMIVLVEAFVRARPSAQNILNALKRQYGAGVYVDPEGPLNIMRGHACVNNDMVAKQRKHAAPMRLAYSRAIDAGKGDCAYTRNAREDEVRVLLADCEAMVYLSEHYRILKSMFTVELGVVGVDKGPGAPFWSLFQSEREKCEELFAALLLLAGGADIRLTFGSDDRADQGTRTVSFVAHDAAQSLDAHVLDLGFADGATLAVVEFFAKYGGAKASQVAGYGLHYTESPSFLIQAYICETVVGLEGVANIFGAAKKIVERLSAGGAGVQQEPCFFTTDAELVNTYTARYRVLYDAELVSSVAQRALLSNWRNFQRDDYCDGDGPRNIALALLKLCYCLCAEPAANSCEHFCETEPRNELQRALGRFSNHACYASIALSSGGSISDEARESVRSVYADFLAVASAAASTSATITDCCGEGISAGLDTDPKNFLVVLAWVLGEPEEELRDLRQLLDGALGDAGSASHCQQIGDRVSELLSRFSRKSTIEAHFDVCTAPGGTRQGSLRLFFNAGCDRAAYKYALKLVFKPARVEIVYVAQKATPKDIQREKFVAAVVREPNEPCRPALPTSAHGVSNNAPSSPSLRILLRESFERCLDRAAHRAVSDAYIAEVSAAKSPLACHIAISHWMAYQPLQSPGEAVKAVLRLLPVLEDSLGLGRDGSNSALRALTADSQVEAVLDNILGSIAVADAELCPFIVGGLRRCVNDRTDLFPSIFSAAGDSASAVEGRDRSAYVRFLDSLAAYDIFEMLLRHAEQRARSKIEAAGSTRGPWDSDVCAALARCFKLRYENGTTCSISGDNSDMRYYRYSICALMAAAANPAEYHSVLRSILGRWDDTFGVFEVYVLLRMAFPRLPKLGPISPKLVAKIFPVGSEVEELEALLRIFAVSALADRDYCGICEVFHGYRALLSPECACRLVRALKRRPSVYSFTSRKLSNRSSVQIDDVRTPVFYSALEELLVECLEDAFDVKTLLVRVRGLPRE